MSNKTVPAIPSLPAFTGYPNEDSSITPMIHLVYRKVMTAKTPLKMTLKKKTHKMISKAKKRIWQTVPMINICSMSTRLK